LVSTEVGVAGHMRFLDLNLHAPAVPHVKYGKGPEKALSAILLCYSDAT
jgi:hypothetical protein